MEEAEEIEFEAKEECDEVEEAEQTKHAAEQELEGAEDERTEVERERRMKKPGDPRRPITKDVADHNRTHVP